MFYVRGLDNDPFICYNDSRMIKGKVWRRQNNR